MTVKIVELPPPTGNADARSCFDEILERNGKEMAACAIVTVNGDGSVGTIFETGDHMFTLLGGVTYLQKRIVAAIEE